MISSRVDTIAFREHSLGAVLQVEGSFFTFYIVIDHVNTEYTRINKLI